MLTASIAPSSLQLKAKVPSPAERKKLIPLALMFFCILFNYTILRDTKDVLLVTARGSGAEVIPFIKTYLMLPSAIGFTTLYSKLCDRLEQKDVFYACVLPSSPYSRPLPSSSSPGPWRRNAVGRVLGWTGSWRRWRWCGTGPSRCLTSRWRYGGA